MQRMASLSLDLDNQWSYMKIHGDEGWQDLPSYFDIFVPHVLDLLAKHDLSITFFIVGQDADADVNKPFLQAITQGGHEVGNHSYQHESWLQKYSRKELEEELSRAENAIADASGQRPIGFRGPGFSWSSRLLETLAARNYLYDASTLPTYIGPLARMYYFWKSDLSKEEKKDRNELFGGWANGMRPIKPYLWQLDGRRSLLEIPVTTIPVIKTPFHLSYLIYLSRFSSLLMQFYLNIAIQLCKMTGTSPSYLLHPLDLIGGDKLASLSFFPGMDMTSERKAAVFDTVIRSLKRHFRVVNMSTHARALIDRGKLRYRQP